MSQAGLSHAVLKTLLKDQHLKRNMSYVKSKRPRYCESESSDDTSSDESSTSSEEYNSKASEEVSDSDEVEEDGGLEASVDRLDHIVDDLSKMYKGVCNTMSIQSDFLKEMFEKCEKLHYQVLENLKTIQCMSDDQN